jgi:hypothetical protein
MIEKLRSGYAIMMKAWEQYQAGLGYEITEGDWKASVNYDGKYVCLSGSGLLFLFSVQSLAEQLLPLSNYFEGEGFERLIKEKAFGDLTLEEVRNGLIVAVKAWNLYKNDSVQVYEKGKWKASVILFGGRSYPIEYILLAGHKKIFLLPTNTLRESNTLIDPLCNGEEFSGIINLIDQELISKGENLSFTKTLWPQVLFPRLSMWNTARYLDIIKNNKATKIEKAILDLGYNDLSDSEARKILCKKSDIKFSETLRQIETIKDYSAELADKYSITALVNSKQLRHDDKMPPIIHFINEPEDRVLAQMCIWTHRQSIKERDFEAKGYNDIKKAIPFLEINVLSGQQEDDIVVCLANYIKKLKVANVSQQQFQPVQSNLSK